MAEGSNDHEDSGRPLVGQGYHIVEDTDHVVLGTSDDALGDIASSDTAVRASTGGAGSVSIVTGGDITSTTSDAISAHTRGSGDVSIMLGTGTTVIGAASGGANHGAGVRAVATGTGNVSLRAGDNVRLTGDQPASLATAASGDLAQSFGANANLTGTSGVVNDLTGTNGGSSTITVGAGGTITASGDDASDPYQGQGIFNGNQGLGATRISTGAGTSVMGSGNGIALVQTNADNASAVSVTTGGDVTGQGGTSRLPAAYDDQLSPGSVTGDGVLAVNAGTGTLTVDTRGGTIEAAQDGNGIQVRNGGGSLTVTNTDALRHAGGVTGGTGLSAANTGTGAVDVTNTGAISDVGGAFDNGILASTETGALTLSNSGTLGAGAALAGTGLGALASGNASISISNAADIDAGSGIDVTSLDAGTITIDQTAGSIRADFGISTLANGGTVAITANGTITATATAIGVNSAGAGNTVALGQNADVRGEVGLIVAGGATRLTNAGALATTDVNGNAVQVESGTVVIGAGAGTYTGAFQVSDAASVLAFDRTDALSLSNTIRGDGRLVQQGTGALTLSGSNTYAGGTTLTDGSLILARGATYNGSDGSLESAAAGTGAITFGATTGTATARLVLETNAQAVGGTFSNTLDSFDASTDTLNLRGFAFGGTSTYTAVNGQLTVLGGTGGTQVQRFALSSSADNFVAQSDGNGGTTITAVCFCAGTRIATPDGAVAVEALAIGTRVITADGEIRTVTWIGRQTLVAHFADPVRSYPIRIRAGAIDEAVPARDLFLSPDHALLIDGVLVQAGALVNDTSVTRVTDPAPRFTYYHVETRDHAIILAEGTPAETFVSNVTRRRFDNFAEYAALFGAEADFEAMADRDEPRAMSRRQVPPGIRARMARRAAALGFVAHAAA